MQTDPAPCRALPQGKHCATILAGRVRLQSSLVSGEEEGGLMGMRVTVSEEPGCLQGGLGLRLAQCGAKNLALREKASDFQALWRRALTTWGKSLPFMGLSSRIL